MNWMLPLTFVDYLIGTRKFRDAQSNDSHYVFRLLAVSMLLVANAGLVAIAAPPGAVGWDSGECIGINEKCTPGSHGSYPRAVKPTEFHPGYYMLVHSSDTESTFKLIADKPDFIGIKKKYVWSEIELAEGVYDFSQIERDLAYLQSMEKRLWIYVVDVQFNENSAPRIPRYMWDDPKYGCGPHYFGTYKRLTQEGGWLPCWWNENVQARQVAVYTALGKRFNNEAYIEGVNLDETAISTAGAKGCDCGYSVGKLENAFKIRILALKRAFPDKVVMQQINYAPYDLVKFAAWLAGNGIAIGGPDVHLNTEAKQFLNEVVYPLYLEYHDVVPTGPDVQGNNYVRWDYTPEELLLGAIDTTNPWYIFWLRKEPYFTDGVLSAIRKHGPLPAARQFYGSLK